MISYVYCGNCKKWDTEECPDFSEVVEGSNYIMCDKYQPQRYFVLCGVRHTSNDGEFRLNSDYEILERENKMLKAMLK